MATTCIDIDPIGDLVIEIENERLRTSSKVLSLASPVFAAMLRPGFREGTVRNTEDNLRVVPLPDDDLDAFKLVCRVIHFQLDQIPQELEIDSLEKLALVCDKYQCTVALRHCAALWLQSLSDTYVAAQLNRQLLVAYLLDLPTAFSDISWRLMQSQAGQFDVLPGLTDHPTVPSSLLDVLNTRRIEINRKMEKIIMQPVSRLLNCSCRASSEGVTKYLSTLRKEAIAPYEEGFEHLSLLKVVEKVSNLPNSLAGESSCTNGSYSRCELATSRDGSMKRKLTKDLSTLMDAEPGLCLDCLQLMGIEKGDHDDK
ncbi:hypothetical protein Z517_05555 [Fonsecaea pedrosoi CBS 271.37]|uniref:BTB domain-containing protein n=1 Tax=Fonsecaea pedrosoi CBS 271.37 TaxID=1442368 RepID=A0A0D2GNM6_9EURO|nr:uncharacterized protein Z517_05555 [Fonsecaea pedrosoi CBS 271.37]KIW82528.1 hypothetical protein Z517_05555 [Fonsecaea pedrosoi CBS 271.37]